MADYGKLLSRIWSDPEFTALDARAQQMYCLLISYSTRNHAGVLPLTLKRWAKSTADASIENVTATLRRLVAAKFVAIDWDSEELLIRTYIRNDEVYRQPNLLKSALKFALQVESIALRWVLHDELLRLPEHKDLHETEATANALVKGVNRTLPEGFGEGLPEGITEPPGVGGYLSGVREHPHLHPSPTPAAEPIDEPPTGHGRAATPAAELVRRALPKNTPKPTQTALRIAAAELLHTGTPDDVVEQALAEWATKTGVGPGILATLAADVIKRRNGHTANGKPPHKMRALVELTREVEAHEQALATTGRKELT